MVIVTEEAYCSRVRLFRWNERIVDSKNLLLDSQGLCLIDLTKTFVSINPTGNGAYEIDFEDEHRWANDVVPLDLWRLSARDELLGTRIVSETGLFLSETAEKLGKQIADYLFDCFQFNNDKYCSISGGPKTVIVVKIQQRRTVDFTDIDLNMSSEASSFFPPVTPARVMTAASNDDELDYEELVSKVEVDEEDPWYERRGRAVKYWLELKSYLGDSRTAFPTKPLTEKEPNGFVEIQPLAFLNRSYNGGGMANSCSICLDGFEAVVAPEEVIHTICLHVFHTRCISKWLWKNNSCPVCRRKHPLLMSGVADFLGWNI